MVDFQNRLAAEQMRVVGLRLKAAGAGGLKLALTRELKAATKPLIADVKQAARDELPKAGGLNEYVAAGRFTSSVRYTGIQIGVRIVNTAPKGSKGGTRQFGSDKGTVRHPVFGHRERKWAETHVTPGWFSGTLEKKAPLEATPRVLAALTETRAALMTPL